MSSEFHVHGGGPTAVARDVIGAYLETEYRIDGDMPCALKIGKHSAALAALHRQHGVDCSAFITAWNPHSEAAPPARNAEGQQALMTTLAQRGLTFVLGVGKHPDDNWPGEESVLVPGLGLDEACALGTRFGQNAIVWSAEDAVPQLILLR